MKLSILAIYAPAQPGGDDIVRHIADVIDNGFKPTDGGPYDPADDFIAQARATAPTGAGTFAAMLTIPAGNKGYAATMARVNIGRPGYPA